MSASSRAAAVAEAASGGRGDMAASKDKQRLLEEEKVKFCYTKVTFFMYVNLN